MVSMNDTKISQLMSLFDARESERLVHNKKIIEMLAPTAIKALLRVLEVRHTDLQWVDVRMVDDVVVLVFTVTYTPATTTSALFQALETDDTANADIEVERVMHMSIPITKAFEDATVVEEFLRKAFVETEQLHTPEPSLSLEQQKQMLFFQEQTKGTLQ